MYYIFFQGAKSKICCETCTSTIIRDIKNSPFKKITNQAKLLDNITNCIIE